MNEGFKKKSNLGQQSNGTEPNFYIKLAAKWPGKFGEENLRKEIFDLMDMKISINFLTNNEGRQVIKSLPIYEVLVHITALQGMSRHDALTDKNPNVSRGLFLDHYELHSRSHSQNFDLSHYPQLIERAGALS